HLQARLPDVLVPAAYVRLEALPLTANGKLDRKALPEPDQSAWPSAEYAAPQGPVEIALARIWADVLKVEQVGRHDNFFELGGHSLLAVSLIERMRQIGLSADVRRLFSQPTLAALATAVGSGREVEVPANRIPAECTRITPDMLPLVQLDQEAIDRIVATVPGGAANVQDIYPLAPLQEGILYHHLSAESGDPYLLQSGMAFDSVERLHTFADALQQVISRHDILRTSVVWEDLPSPQQVVWRHAELTVQPVVVDPADGDVPDQLRARFDARHYRLDLAQAPLLRLVYAEDPARQRVVAILLFHHIVLDNTALTVVLEEMQACLLGQADSLPAPMPYRNYVAQARLGAGAEEHEAFFREMLGGIDEPTLPFGLQDVQSEGHDIEMSSLALPDGLSWRLRAQARGLGVSAASLFHLAWAQLLAATSGQEQVVFGTVLLGRMQGGEGADRTPGVFINTLPLRVDVDAQPAREAIQGTHRRLTALLGHEHASLALAQRCSGVAAPQPLFSALLNYRHGTRHARQALGQVWQGIEILTFEGRTNYPLTLSVDDLEDGFKATVLSRVTVGAQRVIDLLQTTLENLVAALETAPEQPLNQLSILSEQAQQLLLCGFNASAVEYGQAQTIHVRFEEQARRLPEIIAVQAGEQRLTYAELNARANRLAHHLIGLGVQADDRVAICVQRGPQMLVGLLAILKAGAGYVPVDPAYPAERIAYLLQDSAPLAVLAQASTRDLLGAVPVVDLDSADWQHLPDSNPQRPGLTPAHLAYVIYTSGSTGQPKGVMVEHRTLENLVHWHAAAFDLRAGSHTASVAGFGFDAMAWEVWPALCVGATLHLPPSTIGNEHLDELLGWWQAQPLQVAFLPTPVAEYAFSRGLHHPTLRTLLIGGDRLRQLPSNPTFDVINNYGPTEATVVTTSGRVEAGQVLHIGRPIANARVYLLDAHRHPVPVGVAGELYVGGAGVARGYLNRPELSVERFLDDPFSEAPQARMYRTGDLARWLADGTLEYLGRNDDQVKLRGVRVELGEVEAALLSHDGVQDAVVLVRDERLLAWFTERSPVVIEDLRVHLQARLPDVLVPAAYVRLEALPLTANGKLDRKALPEPDQSAWPSAEYAAPQGPVEIALARIWADVLKVEQVGRHDNFFELGGHSLLAVSLIERMRQIGLSADVRRLFSQPTLAALATAVGSGREVEVPANRIPAECTRITPDMLPLVQLDQEAIDRIVATVPGGAANVQDIYPLAPLQEGILYHHLSAETGDPYLLQSRLIFDSVERVEAFADALRQVMARHDILRTAVLWQGLGAPVQVVWREATLAVQERVSETAAGSVFDQLQARPGASDYRLDLAQAPLIRLIYARGPGEGRVAAILLFHHIVLDHAALEVVRDEMQVILSGPCQALPVPVPYRNYVAQTRMGSSEQEHEAFFRDMLGDIDEPTLPFGLQDVQGDGSGIEEVRQNVDAHLSRRLRAQARQLGVSAASLYHLVWALVLGKVSGKDDVVFGTVLVGRMQGGEGADRALGLFINTLPLRVSLGEQGARAGVKATHAQLTALLGHEYASLALVQRCSGVQAPAPLFSALLNYRHTRVQNSTGASSAWSGIQMLSGEERTNYPLALNVDDQGEAFSFTIVTLAHIGAQRLCGYVQQTLESLVGMLEQAPDAPLHRVTILPQSERRKLLDEFCRADAIEPQAPAIHQQFEAQVQRTPDDVAVVQGHQSLSYRELNERANRLAHYLRKRGVQPDSRVAICVERSADMVVGLLAVLKAGGGYVPLDPAYPEDRLTYMLENSAPIAVLTQAATRELLSHGPVPLIDLDAGVWQTEPAHNPPVADLTPAHLAYVIYTSGSTGRPKGVMVEHRGLRNLLDWYLDDLGFHAGDAVLLASSYNFDLTQKNILAPLMVGASLHLAAEPFDPGAIVAQIAEAGITHLNMSPSAFHALVDADRQDALTCLRRVVLGGEPIQLSMLEKLPLPRPVVINSYGPTECSDVVAWHTVDNDLDTYRNRSIPIGRPIRNMQLHVLDSHGQLLPLGVPGEIHIGGVGVARGYLNLPQLSAERFIDDPFSERADARLYKTGDIGRWLPDGTLQYLGRNDDQVKIRGLRIELGEIEARLVQHETVNEAVVLVREDVPGDKRLVAWFTPCLPGQAIDLEALRTYLLAHLPGHMVPLAYVRLDALPLSPNGKLDRKALPSPDLTSVITRGYEAPVGETEINLARLWAETLNVERVGRHDHFFELGGHSLLAVSLIGRLHQEGLAADVSTLFEQPTLAAFAAMTRNARVETGRADVPVNGIVPGTTRIIPAMLPLAELDQGTLDRLVAGIPGGAANVQDIYPLTPLQEGILYHHISAGQGDPYVNQGQFAFADAERFQAFVQALQTVIDRHDILRTAVLWEGLDTPLQVVLRKVQLPLEGVALDVGAGDALAQLHERFDARRFRLDVTRAPLLHLVHAWDESGQRIVAILLFHHLALDHNALAVVSQEMQACLSGRGAQLGRPVPFRNYVAQARLGIGEVEHEAFFCDMLGDIEEPTLPFGLQDVQGDGTGIEEFSLPLGLPLSQRLRTQARQLGVSAASLFHLGWARVLGVLTGQSQVVFGTVLMGRMQGAEAGDRALGLFINTLPLRVDMGARDVRAAVMATHSRLSTLMRHEHAPLALAQRCSGVVAPTPLFSALLNYRHSASTTNAETLAAWDGIEVLRAEERTNYPLTMSVDDLGEAFSLTLLASGDVGARRICAYLQCALEHLSVALEQAPDTPIDQLPVLSQTERDQLLVGFNATQADYPRGLTVHQRFEAQVAARPEAVAAVFLGDQLTYAELNLHANALAHHLRALGVRPDDRVAIVARRGLDTLIGLLAILKAGAAYVPVDPAHPTERLGYLLSDSAPVAILVQPDLRERLPAQAVPVIDLDRRSWPLSLACDPQVGDLTPEHLAYVIYTSGSTGLPKGVMVEHRTLSNLLDWHCEAFDLCAGRHTSCLAGFGFDAMAWEIWPALCVGATLHLAPPRDGNENLDALLDWWRAQPLDVSFLPTPIAEYAFSQNLGHPTLRTLLIGGDRLRQFPRNQSFDVINNYGPTEATVVATSGKVEAGDALHIGRPVSNARVYVLDEQRRPVPVGVPGELYIGGAGVARGYLNRPELTAERFLQDPFDTTPHPRMYRTGDLARWRADGSLEYLGRNDDQVKIRGVRIELGEIENCLNQLPDIRETVLLVREDQPGQPRLVAYFTEQARVDVRPMDELRAQLQIRLPEYMVPTAFVRLDALPLTANGKVDRKALPKPDITAFFTRQYVAPEGELESCLAQIWSELLQVERVGRQDHFFELGGHSLLAMRMVSQVRQRLGVELALGELFANPQLGAVAQVLADAARSSQPTIVPVSGEASLPLSFAQQRLWFLAQMEGANTAYNIPIGLRLRGRLDDDALQRALARIVARHDTLRSRFTRLNDEALVLIAPVEAGLLLRVEDLRGHPQADETLQALVQGEASIPFDLQDDPLIRGRLVRMADDHHVLLLTLHHIIADGWSMGVLTRELMALYQAFSRGEADPLPPLTLQYTDYAVWQRRWLSGEVLRQQSAYWQQALDGAPALLMLPTDRPRPAQMDYAGSTVEVWLPERLSAGLKVLCQRHGVTLYMVMLSAWALLLARLSGQSEVVIGSPVANRTRAEVEGLIGLFVNTLALRIETSAGQDVGAFLARVKARILEAQAHQDLPFEQVVEITRPVRSLAHSPLFQTMLNWRSSDGPALALGDLTLEPVAQPSHFAKFDLTLTLSEGQGGIGGSLEYATALFDESTVRRYVGYFERLLQAMVDNDQAALEQVPLLDDQERHTLLVGFNATDHEYPQALTVHRLFELRAADHPQVVAAAHGTQSLSYGELNARANRLAHYLIGHGVQPGDHVAILLPRSLDLLIAQLAVSKCAAAYVPLDINAPSERLAFMLQDCRAVALLSRRSEAASDTVPRIDLDTLVLEDQPAHDPQLLQFSESPVYIMYTSGSTGVPKGVVVPHRAVGRLVLNNGYADFNARDRVAFASNPAFDASTMDVWGPLLNGGQVVVIDHETLLDPVAFGDELSRSGATILFVTTALFNQYVQLIPQALKGLRILLCGGERSDPAAFRRLLAEAPALRLVHCYGPTETTTYAATFEVRNVAEYADSVPIGRPIGNTRVYVLDAHLQPVPTGVTGELYIGGLGVALGYLNRPELTAEKFLDDPFSAAPAAKMYRTGDLVRWLASGQLECLGRNDDQVKIRGFRIELGEIEHRLLGCEGIKEAVVVARQEAQASMRLVAYFTVHDETLDSAALRSYLQARLPDYMVPSAWVRLDAMPLNNNGKVDRRALPDPTWEASPSQAYQAPANALEASVAGLWAEVLQLERVGRHDNFFELGGHSLLAVRLVNLMRSEDLDISLAELFQHASVESVCELLSRRSGAVEQTDGLITVRASGRGTPLFLVHEFSGRDLYFPALGMHIGGEFPIYGLPGITSGQPLLRTMECLAARLVGLIQTVQPHGPYRLAGWSFGGVLAYEVAQQLLGMDETVAFVGLIDSYVPRLAGQPPAYWRDEQVHQRQLLLHCRAHWTTQGAGEQAELAHLARLEAEMARMDFEDLLKRCREQQLLEPELAAATSADIWHYLDREVAHGHALTHYRINPIHQPVHLFRAQERRAEMAQLSPSLGWVEELSSDRVRCIDVPGDHQSMMKSPHIQHLGHAINQALQEAAPPPPQMYQPLLTIQSGHLGHTPIFCVPGAGDGATGFIHLTEALGPEWPIFGLQPRGLDDMAVPHSRVEAAAACYVRAIEQLYPAGPVHLIGHSFGGWVAYAMAARLHSGGREVASLTLIDSEVPGDDGLAGKAYTTTAALQRLIDALQLSCGKSLGIDPLAFAEADDVTQLRLLHDGMVRAGVLSERSSPQAMHGPVRTFAVALRTPYQPQQAYAGPVRLAVVDDPALDESGNQREQAATIEGWRRLVANLTVWHGQGNHFTILKAPDVFSFAAWWLDGLKVPVGDTEF
ncbi:non-ribosomal peptide synthetase, partial [Pseudomonas sp. Pf153]|uniref:non-ribosomal peptide synthetase n=1 Tax=Pseudomonas sp. Pf153 TaxID=1699309 RepID=UPI0009EC09BF